MPSIMLRIQQHSGMFDHFPSLHGQLWSGYKDVFLQSAFEAKLIDSIRSMPSLLTSLSIYPIPLN